MSANNQSAIPTMAKQYSEYLQTHPNSSSDMAYTLAFRRERLQLASYCLIDGTNLSSPPPAVPSSGVERIAFIFTGQGEPIPLVPTDETSVANIVKELNG